MLVLIIRFTNVRNSFKDRFVFPRDTLASRRSVVASQLSAGQGEERGEEDSHSDHEGIKIVLRLLIAFIVSAII